MMLYCLHYSEDNDSDDIVNAIVDLYTIVSAADTSFKFYDINDVEIDTPSSYLLLLSKLN